MPTKRSITGNENPVHISPPEQALTQFYKAFNARDIDLMSENWGGSGVASMDDPHAEIKRTFTRIGNQWRQVC